ncbi:MAG: OmpA family protein [Bacteroidales bacterium]|nr:OmpA family protein [Bacteroidales bacterium]MCF8403545.1 OmpA family protein [Bacteroidales bacterium]
MIRTIIFQIILQAIFTQLASAQSIAFNKYNFPNHKEQLSNALSNIKAGDKLYDQGPGVYHLAVIEYLKANKFNPDNALLNYKIGRCYMIDNDKNNAIKYFEKAIELDERISLDMEYNDVNWLLAKAYHLDYQFDKAIQKYKKHKSALTPEQLVKENELIDKKMEECETAKEMVANPSRVFVDDLGEIVNSAFPDYRPLVVPEEDMILFTSVRENTTGGKRDDDSYYFEDIYVTYYDDMRWTLPENSYDLNSNNHDATAGIASDGSILFVYKSAGGNNLYASLLKDGIYTLPDKLANEINSGMKQASASLSFDKTTLYFTSLREDGYGGQDIYYSIRDAKDRWQEAINIGATINTPYDEEGVYITPDGKNLYFSSKGHNTMGGYDIFKSELVDGRWSNPINLGYPINTPDDDVFFTMAANGQRGYYSSKKKDGYGGQDLYIITFLGASKPLAMFEEGPLSGYHTKEAYPALAPKIEQNTILEGKILDEGTLTPLQAMIEITDNSKNELLASFESNSSTGAYLISLKPGKNYGITVSRKDYLFHSENVNIPDDAEARKITKDVLLKKAEVGVKIVLNNIFFDFNKATLRKESEAELDRVEKFMTDTPTLKIEISGHTDNIGSAAINQKLSENRAKAVVDYLLEKGIEAERLVYKGYGFEQPVSSNDTEEGRQQNRRTEFKILGK